MLFRSVLRNIEQFLVEDPENQTAYLKLPEGTAWWYWYGSEVEANTWYLKLLARTAPQAPRTAGLVKYLLNNRRHATYWNSTRDTAYAIEALRVFDHLHFRVAMKEKAKKHAGGTLPEKVIIKLKQS